MTPEQRALFDAAEATWPAAATTRLGPWLIRDGQGGGKRVSAIIREGAWQEADIAQAETAARALGQPPLFQIRDGEEALDAALAARGYRVIDPVSILTCSVTRLVRPDLPRLAAIPSTEPLAIQAEIWRQGGIGPARLSVMARAATPKTHLLGRENDRPRATAYLGLHGGIAMLHALHVLPEGRRKGVARDIMAGAANWAKGQNAREIAVLVVESNAPALRLYEALGMTQAAYYHYRIKEG